MNPRSSVFFKLQRLIGSRAEEYYREFLGWEEKSVAELEAVRQERLTEMLTHAVRHVPFYRERVARGTKPELIEFPVLARREIKANFLDLMIPALRHEYEKRHQARGYSWLEVKTGGSTGVPTTVIHDSEFRDHGRASRLYSQYLCGFPFGEPYFKLWGSMKDISRSRESMEQRLIRRLSRQRIFNAFQMSELNMAEYIGIMNRSKINHLMAYVDALFQISRYALRKNIDVRPLKSIMSCAGTLTDAMRADILRAFHGKIHNKYGTRECSDMICECEEGGLHIFSHQVVIEVVDECNRPLPAGTAGRMLITLLFNRSFPLIRYEIGDVGSLGGGSCLCGRPFPLMEKIEGRSIEFLTNNEGEYVTPLYIIHLIGVVHNPGFIKRFQLIQNSLHEFHLKIECEPENLHLPNRLFGEIETDLKAVLGPHSIITIEITDRIPEAANGKFFYTLNRFREFR